MGSASFIFFAFACAFDEAQKKVRPTAITPPRMYFVICCIFTVLLLVKTAKPMRSVSEHPEPIIPIIENMVVLRVCFHVVLGEAAERTPLHRTRNQSENATGASRSDRPMLRYISVRTLRASW